MKGSTKEIVYFAREGRENLADNLRVVIDRAQQDDISTAVVFTRDGDAALRLRGALPKNKQVVAVTFPVHHPMFDREGNRVSHELADPELRTALVKKKIAVVTGTMPLEEVVIPRIEDPKLAGIRHALNLFGVGMRLCVQAVAMATDAGYLSPGDTVAVMTADTSVVIRASSSAFLFHPKEGMEILEILCKPRRLTLLHKSGEE